MDGAQRVGRSDSSAYMRIFNILLLVNFSNEVLVYVLCIYFHALNAHTVPMALGGVKLLLKVCAR